MRNRHLTSLLLALLLCPQTQAQTPQVVTLVSDPWPPYFLGTLGADATGGTGFDSLQKIFDRIDGVEVRFPMVPWKRALQQVRQGTMDGIGILLKTAERERYMDYTDELFSSQDLVWYTKQRYPDGFSWQQPQDLAAHTIGVIRGHSYGAEIDALLDRNVIKTIPTTGVEQLFSMLARNRIDLTFANDAVGYAAAKTHQGPNSEIVAATTPLSTDVFHIAFSKKSDARKLIPQINAVITELRAGGVIEQIIGNVPR